MQDMSLAQLNTTTEDPWLDPEPLPQGLPPVNELDPDIIPDALRPRILDISDRLQIPPDFSAAAINVLLGSIIGRQVSMQPKALDHEWLVTPNLWGAIVGRPSVMKSPSITEVMKPLNKLVTEAISEHEKALGTYKVELEIYQARQSAQKDQIKRAVKNDEDLSHFRNKTIETADKPVLRRYKSEDPTVEKLGELLLENPNGLLVYRDELTGWLNSLEKQGREGDRSFYLESWNGTGSFTVDRIGRGTLHVPSLCISLLGSIQPGPLGDYIRRAHNGGTGDDGLIQRFQMLVWPDSSNTWKNVDRIPDNNELQKTYEIFKRLDNINPMEIGAVSHFSDSIPTLKFSPESQEIFNTWRQKLEKRLRDGTISSSALEAHLAKYRSLMPSLAMIFHLVEFVSGNTTETNVGENSTIKAAAWCEYLESHANRLYSSIADPSMESARELLKRIKKHEVANQFTARDIYRNGWTKLSRSADVAAALEVLEDFGWVRSEVIPTTGRSQNVFYIHPSLCHV
ncbi:MAG: YfjI family protein [Gammaproteobacteria bacterium]|nr:YfjI family protein [Gammaproteobacteria bacterium]MDH5799626.1 YfjI family protein [Gammaproteobacteria bacterium]